MPFELETGDFVKKIEENWLRNTINDAQKTLQTELEQEHNNMPRIPIIKNDKIFPLARNCLTFLFDDVN